MCIGWAPIGSKDGLESYYYEHRGATSLISLSSTYNVTFLGLVPSKLSRVACLGPNKLTLYSRETVHRVQFSRMVDLYHFMGLIFIDMCTHTHYVLYNRVYFTGLICTVGSHLWKLDPLRISSYTVDIQQVDCRTSTLIISPLVHVHRVTINASELCAK